MSIRTQITSSSIVGDSKKNKDAHSLILFNLQWQLYITGLILSNAVMTFFAFWFVYYLRFEWFVQDFGPVQLFLSDTIFSSFGEWLTDVSHFVKRKTIWAQTARKGL